VSTATSGPPVNPPSHGDPTNPAQPRLFSSSRVGPGRVRAGTSGGLSADRARPPRCRPEDDRVIARRRPSSCPWRRGRAAR
jgi:hypothetical protein